MTSMKAIVLKDFGGTEMMAWGEAPVPEISDTQVLVRTHATSVNAPDIMQRMGKYPPPPGESDILGLEVAGTIEKTGAAVSRWKHGDRVMALVGGGGYAEFTAAYQDHVMPLSDSMTFIQAACVCETYLTAYLNVFLLGGLGNHQKVLLHGGGGGVNTAAIHLCRSLVPETEVFVTASSGKLDRVRALGADHVIDYSKQSFADVIAGITGKQGVDVVLDHIGGPYFSDNLKSLAIGGRLMQIGVARGAKSEINLALMMVKRQQIIGSVLRSRPVEEKARIIGQFSEQVLPLLHKGEIVPLVSDVFPLSEAAKAHQAMEGSRHFGKIALEVG